MSQQYRYPGAKPFETTEENIFFGRDEDIKKMLRLIELEQSLVLYGKSGLGKSSLINAGLVPRIQEKGRYEPIKIRFGAYTQGKKDMPLALAKESIVSSETWLRRIKGNDNDSLWYHLKNRQIKDKTQGYLLIFDQFEELFSYPENHVADFAKQLSEIIYTLIPNRFRAEFEENKEQLSKEQMEALHTPLDLKVLIAIRSDRMSLMNRLKPYLPDVLIETYEIQPLTEIQAEDAILNPAYKKGNFISPIFDYEDKALSEILDFLTKQRTQNVESFQLQILCQHVEQLVIDKGIKEITLEDIGDIASVYENYYLNQIARLGDDATQLAARKLVEEGLIFEEEERRLSLYDVQISKHYGVDADLLRKLVDTHLLRAEPSLRGGYTYELSHDTLVAPVLRAKALRVQVEKEQQAIAEKERLEKEKLALQREAEEERQKAEKERQLKEEALNAKAEAEAAKEDANSKRRRANMFLFLSVLLLATAIYAFLDANTQRNKANEESEKAKAKSKELQISLDNIKKQQKITVAKELKIHGDAYKSIDKDSMAIATYRAAMDSLKGYETVPVYLELEEAIDELQKKIN